MRKPNDVTTVNTITSFRLSFPVTSSRFCVRGFSLSKLKSTILLNAIAADLAEISAKIISNIMSQPGKEDLLIKKDIIAKGNANMVCENFIILKISTSFFKTNLLCQRIKIYNYLLKSSSDMENNNLLNFIRASILFYLTMTLLFILL